MGDSILKGYFHILCLLTMVFGFVAAPALADDRDKHEEWAKDRVQDTKAEFSDLIQKAGISEENTKLFRTKLITLRDAVKTRDDWKSPAALVAFLSENEVLEKYFGTEFKLTEEVAKKDFEKARQLVWDLKIWNPQKFANSVDLIVKIITERVRAQTSPPRSLSSQSEGESPVRNLDGSPSPSRNPEGGKGGGNTVPFPGPGNRDSGNRNPDRDRQNPERNKPKPDNKENPKKDPDDKDPKPRQPLPFPQPGQPGQIDNPGARMFPPATLAESPPFSASGPQPEPNYFRQIADEIRRIAGEPSRALAGLNEQLAAYAKAQQDQVTNFQLPSVRGGVSTLPSAGRAPAATSRMNRVDSNARLRSTKPRTF